MSAVSELKITINFKDTLAVGIEAFIKKEDKLKKNTLDTGNVFKKVFEKKRSLILDTKVKNVEVAKAHKELEKKFENIKANISSSSIGKSMSNLKEWTKEKVLKVKLAVAVNKESFDIGVQDFMRKAMLKAEKPIEKIKQKLQPLKKMSYQASALKDMAGDRLKTLTVKPRKVLASATSKGKSAYGKAMESVGKFSNVKGFAGRVAGGLKSAGGSILGFAKAGFAGLAGIAAQGIKQAVEAAVGAGAILEKQNLYMDQAIAANNPNIGAAEVKKQRDSYMKQLRDSAAGTGMDSSDVIAAGTQAVSITGGDTKEAMELVKVAQDMAAMNPGKSVAEAMEALAAAKNGETETLKEFNTNVSQEDLNNLGFKGVVQQRLKPQFAGGAEKLSGTGAGLVSVIKGKLNNKLSDMGLSIIEKLKPALESVVKLIDRYSPALDAFGEGIASGIGLAIECVQNIAGLIGEKFGWIGEKSGFLKEVFLTSWEGIQNGMATAWEFIQPVMDLISNGAMLLFNIFQWAFPGIQAVIENVWAFIKPIFEDLGGAISWVADKVGKVAEWFGKGKDSSSGGGGGAGAFWDEKEESLVRSQPAISSGAVDALRVPNIMGSSLQNEAGGMDSRSKAYTVPQANLQGSRPNVQNQAFTININGVNKSTNEIMNEMVPKLRLALANV